MHETLTIFLFAINAIAPVIGLIGLGYLLKVTGLFTEEFLKVGNKLVFRVLLPVLLFSNMLEMEDFQEIRWDAVCYVMIVLAFIFLIGMLFARLFKEPAQKGVILQCVFRSNFALIGVPLAELMAGSEGVKAAAILSAFTIPAYNVLAVIALSLYLEDKGTDKLQMAKKLFKGIVTNPLILGVVSGIFIVFLRTKLKQFGVDYTVITSRITVLDTVITYLARTASPISLLVLGGQFNFSRIRGYKSQLLLGVSSRLILTPFIGIGLAVILHKIGFLNFEPAMFASFVALFATPVAVSSAIMAEEMHNDGQLAGQLVVWTTLFSALSLFCIVVILKALALL